MHSRLPGPPLGQDGSPQPLSIAMRLPAPHSPSLTHTALSGDPKAGERKINLQRIRWLHPHLPVTRGPIRGAGREGGCSLWDTCPLVSLPFLNFPSELCTNKPQDFCHDVGLHVGSLVPAKPSPSLPENHTQVRPHQASAPPFSASSLPEATSTRRPMFLGSRG